VPILFGLIQLAGQGRVELAAFNLALYFVEN
jgi:hypothetical protein